MIPRGFHVCPAVYRTLKSPDTLHFYLLLTVDNVSKLTDALSKLSVPISQTECDTDTKELASRDWSERPAGSVAYVQLGLNTKPCTLQRSTSAGVDEKEYVCKAHRLILANDTVRTRGSPKLWNLSEYTTRIKTDRHFKRLIDRHATPEEKRFFKGLGTMLLHYVIRYLTALHILWPQDYITLIPVPSSFDSKLNNNAKLVRYYRSLGFEFTDTHSNEGQDIVFIPHEARKRSCTFIFKHYGHHMAVKVADLCFSTATDTWPFVDVIDIDTVIPE